METKTSYGSTSDVALTKNGYSNYIYLVDRFPDALIERFNELKGEKTIVSAYALNSRHYMLVYVEQKIKKIKQIKKDK